MSTISLSKLRKLPYHERWKLVSTSPTWPSEAKKIIEDYPKWEHEKIEKKIVKAGFATASMFITYDSINAYRLCSMLMNKIHKEEKEYGTWMTFYPSEYTDIIQYFIPSLTKLPLIDINKKAIEILVKTIVECYHEEMKILDVIKDTNFLTPFLVGSINCINALINCSLARDSLIDFNLIANAMFEYLYDDLTLKTIFKLKNKITDHKLLQEINDQIIMYDIIT